MNKLLAIFALPEEVIPLTISHKQIQPLVCGVGKTQTAARLAFAIAAYHPDAVINIGTVGTYRHNIGDILVCRRFIDRDMSRVPIDQVSKELDLTNNSFGHRLNSIINGKEQHATFTLNTGDNFVTSINEDLGCDAVDMESFAAAWTCHHAGIPFLAVKYVTDILGNNSIAAWADKLSHARTALEAYFLKYGHLI